LHQRIDALGGAGFGHIARASTWSPWKSPLSTPTRFTTASLFLTLRHLARVAYVGGDELRLPEAPQRFEEKCLARIELSDPNASAGLEDLLRHIAADEAAAAEQCNQPVCFLNHR
jgi:hypothetical protein